MSHTLVAWWSGVPLTARVFVYVATALLLGGVAQTMLNAVRRRRARSSRVSVTGMEPPRLTCPGCGRKALRYGFGQGDSLAATQATFRKYCERCGYVSNG